jgi:transposase
VETLARQTGVRIHVATMSRALALIQARRRRLRPTVRCPWSPVAKARRLGAIRHAALAARGCLCGRGRHPLEPEDRTGLDGPGPAERGGHAGDQREMYLAGALDVRTGLLTWVERERKTSALFIALLGRLRADYHKATRIHVILDNYRIHDSKITQAALQGLGGRIRRHFLPPYCPKENQIERVCEDLHANVTRNHTCRTIDALMMEVREYLWWRNRIQAGIERRWAGQPVSCRFAHDHLAKIHLFSPCPLSTRARMARRMGAGSRGQASMMRAKSRSIGRGSVQTGVQTSGAPSCNSCSCWDLPSGAGGFISRVSLVRSQPPLLAEIPIRQEVVAILLFLGPRQESQLRPFYDQSLQLHSSYIARDESSPSG